MSVNTSSSHKAYPRLAPAAVTRVCGATYAARGRGIVERGQVIGVTVAEELGELIGLVQGTAPEPYEQSIALPPYGDFENECSCPVGESCKHVAAALYHYMAHREELFRRAAGHEAAGADSSLDRWLEALGKAAADAPLRADEPVPGGGVMLYQLDAMRGKGPGGFRLTLHRSRVLVRGGYGKESAANVSSWHLPDWCTALDRDILRALDGLGARRQSFGYARGGTATAIEGPSGARVLRLLVESGRCFVGAGREHALRDGGVRPLVLGWRGSDDGQLRLDATLAGMDEWQLVPTDPPWYIGASAGHGGPLAGALAGAPTAAVLRVLLAAPALDADGARRTSEFIGTRLPDTALPLPLAEGTAIIDESPVPVLVLDSRDGSDDPRDFRATFALRYGDAELAFEPGRGGVPVAVDDERGRRIVRRRPIEERHRALELRKLCPALEPVAFGSSDAADPFDPDDTLDELELAGALGLPGALDRPGTPADGGPAPFVLVPSDPDLVPSDPDVAARVLAWREVLEAVPELEALGWTIETHPPFGLDFEKLEAIDAAVSETDHGWFELALAMTHEGQRFALLPLIVTWLEAGEPERPILVESESGEWLEIAPEVFMPVAETLIELYDHFPDDEALRLPRQRASLLDALAEAWRDNAVWHGGEALFALAEKLKHFEGIIRPELPETLEATLRPYQHDGVAWLGSLAEYGFGGILADDMGLGKTLQTLAHLLLERDRGRLERATLIVAPTSLLGNWQREAARFVPTLRSAIWHGAERHERGLDTEDLDLVITSYALALRDRDFLAEQPFGCLVLDEAQAIKNAQAKTTRALKSLPIEHRLCLSGTPLENHLGELWSQMDFLMPHYLGSHDRFTRRFRTPIEKHGDDGRQRRLNALVRPFMLRRKKEEVASELPPKTDIVQSVTLGSAQARLYESIRLSMEAKVKRLLAGKGLARSRIELLDALLKLRQTCCHPALVKLPSARKVHESAKTEQLMAMLEEMIAEGRRILLFSQFTQMLALIEKELAARDIDHVKLTGRTRKRDVVVDAFQQGEAPLFLISLKAGGTGLNLTAADTVIHYDPWWNPAVESQASARAHRIGQDKPVFVYRLVAADTVEERILEMQARKQALADATIDGEGGALAGLTAEDLLGLFAARE